MLQMLQTWINLLVFLIFTFTKNYSNDQITNSKIGETF
jgi:hypothetical protein